MVQFIDGSIMMALAVCAIFFLRFWRRTGDRLFCMLAVAFAMLAIGRIMLGAWAHQSAVSGEHQLPIFVNRLAAFVIILVGIIDKNRRAAAASVATRAANRA